MESCELRLALDEPADIGDCSTGARCCRRTSVGSRGDRPGRHGSAMSALLKAPAFRQYSSDVKDLTSMSRQRLVEVLKASLVDAATHDLTHYLDSCQQLGFSTRRYFSHDRDVILTSSGDSSPDDDVIKHLLRGGHAWNSYRAFRMPTFAEFLAEGVAKRRRNRSTFGTNEQRTSLKVNQGQGQHSELICLGRASSNSSCRQPKICTDNTVQTDVVFN